MRVVRGENGAVIIIYFLMEPYIQRMQIWHSGACRYTGLGEEKVLPAKLQNAVITGALDALCSVMGH